jgi:hypothetical protein
MARKTEVRFATSEEFRARLPLVDLVAVVAGHSAELMDSSVGLEKFLVLCVAIEAGIGSDFCILTLKGENKSFPFGLRMFFSRAVAGLTSLFLSGDFRINHALPVRRIFHETFIEVFMAILAGLGSDISSFLPFCLVLAEGNKAEKEQNDGRGDQPYRQIPASTHTQSPSLLMGIITKTTIG